jgi:hypothetical protein
LILTQYRFNDFNIINVADFDTLFRHLKFVISIVEFVLDNRPFYFINTDVVSLFADSSLLVFSEIEFVMILIDVFPINLNE